MGPTAATSRSGLRVRLFGRVQLALGDTPLADDAWSRRTARTLLLLLLSTPSHRLPREAVIEHLWPESSPDAAAKSLYVAVHALRRVLEPELRSGRDSSYVDVAGDVISLLPGAVEWIDVEAFEAKLDASTGDRREHLTAALGLYSGDFLADEPWLDWPSIRREQLRGRWREAVLEYAALERAADRSLLAVPAIERVLQSDPTDETVYRALMRALAAAGRREDALRQYERCAAALRDELGIEPGAETAALADEIRTAPVTRPAGFQPGAAGAPARIDNLPAPPNALVGRAREVEELLDLLVRPDIRLVTVTGPGGVGKTRLALEAASLASDEFEGGVCFVSLAPLRDSALVLPAIARELGLEEAAGQSPLAMLEGALRDRQLLLVLDNLEQVLDAASDLADLLAAAPRIAMLVTSREPLHLRSEHDFPLGPLPAPDPARVITAGSAARYPSVELFVERAAGVNRRFALTEENAGAIGVLCARLDGLPLAIELAAARARHLQPDQLVAGLAARFSLLSGGFRDLPDRQRTMRGAIAWSYDLLSPEEQALFRRLSIFVGGFTADAAASIAALDPASDTQARLDALVDKGLVRIDDVGDIRYAMFETIREFGLELLAAHHELDDAAWAHANWCITLAEAAGPELTGPRQADWRMRLEREHANVRAALGLLLQDGSEERGTLALRLAASLWRFWWSTGNSREGRAWLERALALAPGEPADVRAFGHYAAGELAEELTDYDAAITHFETALAIRRDLNDAAGIIEALNGLGIIARSRGELDRAEAMHLEALALLGQAGNAPRMIANTYNNLGSIAYFRGDTERTAHYWEQALALLRTIDDHQSVTAILGNLGALALMMGNIDRAIAFHEEATALARRINDFSATTRGLINHAGALYERGNYAKAASMFEEALERCRETGDRYAESVVLYNLGKIAELSGEPTLAEQRFGESLAHFHAAGNLPGAAACLERIAALSSGRGEDALAVRLLAAADAIRAATGAARDTVDHGEYQRELDAVRDRLGDNDFASAWSGGASLSVDDAVAVALSTVAASV